MFSIRSSILRIIFTTCVASWIWCFLDSKVSKTFCSAMLATSEVKQEIPIFEFPSWIYLALALCKASFAFIPELSARIKGICSSALANPQTAYC